MKLGRLLLVGTILLITASMTPLATAQDSDWYIGGGFGRSDDDVLDEKGDGLKVFGGYRFRRNVAIEAAFVDLGEFDFQGVPDDLEQDGVTLEVVGILPVGEQGAVFGKLGVFSWEFEASNASDDGTDETFGIGGQYRFGNHWAVRAEWERFNDVSGGDVDLISASVVYSFRKPATRARKRPTPPPKREPEKTEISRPKATPERAVPEKRVTAPPELAAAERGDANAQYKLGYMYSIGRGVPTNDAEAVRWYRKAAAQGYARAQYNLGAAYANGTGVTANMETAVDWFFKAGQSFLRQGNRNLALRVVDTIERVIPGHTLASELLAAIRRKFGQ